MSNPLVPLARKITAALGNDWCTTDGYWSDVAMLRNLDGEQIHLSRTRPARLVLWATRPRELAKHWPYDAPRHQITVADTKTPQQIATETTRRLLPGYRQTIAQAREHKRRSDQQNAARDELVAALARALNTVVLPFPSSRSDEHERAVEIGERGGDGVHLHVGVSPGDTMIEFTVRVPRVFAVEFAALVTDLRQRTTRQGAET